MEELEKLEEDRRNGRLPGPVRKRGIASNEMCTFLILNISSLQLIPMNIIAYRSQYGSVNPNSWGNTSSPFGPVFSACQWSEQRDLRR